MIIGIPKEIKNNENRVGLTPAGTMSFKNAGHQVLVEKDAGAGSGFTNEAYEQAGAIIIEDAAAIWAADMVMKVKEPTPKEYQYFRKDLLLFTYLHLANEPELTKQLLENEVTSIAYETVSLEDRSLPLLSPMSEIAGKMAAQIGAQFLQSIYSGEGILLGGVPGVPQGEVVIIGGGISGLNAAKVAVGLGAHVTILDVNINRLRELDNMLGNQVTTLVSNAYNIEASLKKADLAIGAVLIPGAKAPKLVTEAMIAQMKPGAIVVDIAIDQGGIFETTDTITTHDHPTYIKHGVVHYAVANMPGAVPRTSTMALSNATTPYGLLLASQPFEETVKQQPALFRGVNTYQGKLTYQGVAEAFDLPYTPLESLLTK